MKLSTRKKNTLNWLWLAWVPIIGGGAIAYEGYRTKTRTWLILGTVFIIINLVYTSNQLLPFLLFWMAQILTAFYIQRKSYKKNSRVLDSFEEPQIIDKNEPKIDINKCSKDEMVYQLELPIVYANNIELLRNEGYFFTDIEELSDIAGIPKNYLKKLEPLITFRYHPEQEEDLSWRRVNSYSTTELIRCGLDEKVAQRIIEEREKNGQYYSVIDIKHRTGLSLNQYREII
ncbi:comEA protein [Aphanothece hegewaldii CCALA 016]|uniref:ComEA protein n=1 Tax=Aphanothece hegewaldii CCALA 016 TaxID=2107694 RepID=A0A2T1M1N8_9CHRO|nr:helix-hairpin-helix domain-containing protein [Aphanothece hegewaldii]PSF38519.1 comEA protein [Aphanothece hegewaldii CCALA 016]